MPGPKSDLAARYGRASIVRDAILHRLEETVRLADPKLLLPLNFQQDTSLPRAAQSFGLRMMSNLVGAMMMSGFPADIPWAILENPESIRSSLPPDRMELVEAFQFRRTMIIHHAMRNGLGSVSKPSPTRFHSGVRRLLRISAGTGDGLARIHDDARWQVFPRRSYVTVRDSCGEEVIHGTKERIDARAMSPEHFEKSGLQPSVKDNDDIRAREQDLYTWCEWQPSTGTWVLTQEVNGHETMSETYDVCPYVSAPYELIDGEDYGRGFVEQNAGDLETFDFVTNQYKKLLVVLSRCILVKDASSGIADDDLNAPDGEVIPGLVRDGKVPGLAMFSSEKNLDTQQVLQGLEFFRRHLAKSSLIESEMTPVKDRVTAFQVSRIMEEVSKATDGIGPTMTEHVQHQAFLFTHRLLQQKKMLPKIPDEKGLNNIVITTGTNALAMSSRIEKMAQLLSLTASVLPESMSIFNQEMLARRWMRYGGVYEPGAIKTAEERQAEQENALRMQAAAAMAQALPDAAGKIAVNALQAA